MPRVLFLGLKLPQNVAEFLRTPLSLCDALFHASRHSQKRTASDFVTRFPELPKEENQEDQGKESESASPKRVNALNRRVKGWKAPFLNAETSIDSVRHRLSRPPPKYACPPEGSECLGHTSDRIKDISKEPPRIVVHPLHRRPKRRLSQKEWDFYLEELLSEPSSFPSDKIGREAPSEPKIDRRDWLLQILSETNSTDTAWKAYNTLLAKNESSHLTTDRDESPQIVSKHRQSSIPYAHLHRLARLLAGTRPRTRKLFLRLLSVLTTLRSTGGTVFVWEWNALIDSAGKGWRKTSIEDYRAALGVFKDMVNSGVVAAPSMPSSTVASAEFEGISPADMRPVTRPDIISFTTLVDIASRSLSERAIIHATSLLEASELPWNNITHMAKLQYFIHTRQLQGVRDILQSTLHYGLDISTLNACMWAYARNGHLLVALEVYNLLRSNIPRKDRADLGEGEKIGSLDFTDNHKDGTSKDNPILNIPEFAVPPTMRPDRITYSLLVQALCYHGAFTHAMKVFHDMVCTIDPATRPVLDHPVGRPPRIPGYNYKPSLSIYRAIFLGFARHANRKRALASSLFTRRRHRDAVSLSEFAANLTPSGSTSALSTSLQEDQYQDEASWTLTNLDMLFESFLEMGWELDHRTGGVIIRPGDRMIYWIMVAYARTSNRDVAKMYRVWQQLDDHFGYSKDGVSLWTGRLARIAEVLERRHKLAAAQYDKEEINHSQ